METQLIQSSPCSLPADQAGNVAGFLALWASRLAATSRTTYHQALGDFAAFIGEPSPEAATARLLAGGKGKAAALLIGYQAHLREVRGLAPNTVNVRVAAVRSMLAFANELDLIPWVVKVRNLKARVLKDTRGPGEIAAATMLRTATAGDSVKDKRDAALLAVLTYEGLRKAEALALDVQDVDLPAARLWILGKGHREKLPKSIAPETAAVLRVWLKARAAIAAGDALFVSTANHNYGGRMSGQSAHEVVRKAGEALGLHVTAHQLRHVSGTAAAEEGGLLGTMAHLRHTSPAVSQRYVDNLEDKAGAMARAVGTRIGRLVASPEAVAVA